MATKPTVGAGPMENATQRLEGKVDVVFKFFQPHHNDSAVLGESSPTAWRVTAI